MDRYTEKLRTRDYLFFVGTVSAAHVVTYVVAGTLAYHFIYEAAIAAGGFDASMRNPNNPEEWQHVLNWMLPAEVLRGALFGIALCPFLRDFSAWTFRARFASLLGLLMVFSVWSVTMPAAGSIEGWVYLRPGSGPKLPNPLLGYLEVPLQLSAFALFVSWRAGKYSLRKAESASTRSDAS